MKKAVLLMWKLTLATFGGFNDAHNEKNKKRREAGLPEIENAAEIMKELTPVTTHIDTMVMNMAEGQIDYNGPQHRPKLQRNQKRNTSELEEDFDNLSEHPDDRPSTPAPTLGRGSRRPSLTSSRPVSPTRSESSLGPSLESPLATWTYPYLPWQPKVTLSEMDDFIRMARSKYLDYSFKYPKTESQMLAAVNNRYGLPKPIQNSMKIMDKYIYKSLADVQRESWAETEKHQLTKPFKRENTSIEILYEKIWQNLSMYIISLLKLLLAAAPTANKSDIFMQDQSGPHSIQLGPVFIKVNYRFSEIKINFFENPEKEGTQLFKLPVMLISLDVSRHKEIVTKAIVGFILLLMKHLKNNHINQFENLSHHLYGSNCFPLIAKFFNQNMTMFVTQRNQIPKLDLRNAIRGTVSHQTTFLKEYLGLPVIQALIERATEDQMPYCWRNMFSSICFLRILVKIMKGKPWRVIWLVKYKATNIFKKTLLVKHGVFQLYVLKVIKLHARFLGRQWRKNNMDVVSGIYG